MASTPHTTEAKESQLTIDSSNLSPDNFYAHISDFVQSVHPSRRIDKDITTAFSGTLLRTALSWIDGIATPPEEAITAALIHQHHKDILGWPLEPSFKLAEQAAQVYRKWVGNWEKAKQHINDMPAARASKCGVLPSKGDLEGSNVESSHSGAASGSVNIRPAGIHTGPTDTNVNDLQMTIGDSGELSRDK